MTIAQEYRVVIPSCPPRYHRTAYAAWAWATKRTGAVIHTRTIHPNGATSPWTEITTP